MCVHVCMNTGSSESEKSLPNGRTHIAACVGRLAYNGKKKKKHENVRKETNQRGDLAHTGSHV